MNLNGPGAVFQYAPNGTNGAGPSNHSMVEGSSGMNHPRAPLQGHLQAPGQGGGASSSYDHSGMVTPQVIRSQPQTFVPNTYRSQPQQQYVANPAAYAPQQQQHQRRPDVGAPAPGFYGGREPFAPQSQGQHRPVVRQPAGSRGAQVAIEDFSKRGGLVDEQYSILDLMGRTEVSELRREEMARTELLIAQHQRIQCLEEELEEAVRTIKELQSRLATNPTAAKAGPAKGKE